MLLVLILCVRTYCMFVASVLIYACCFLLFPRLSYVLSFSMFVIVVVLLCVASCCCSFFVLLCFQCVLCVFELLLFCVFRCSFVFVFHVVFEIVLCCVCFCFLIVFVMSLPFNVFLPFKCFRLFLLCCVCWCLVFVFDFVSLLWMCCFISVSSVLFQCF